MKIYELFTGDELKVAEKIQQRRYQLLIHSCIYYHLNASVVSDDMWNKWSIELCNLQSQHPDIAKKVPLYEYFHDWDGSTGAFLPITLDWVVNVSKYLLNIQDQEEIPVEEIKVNKKRRLF